MPDPVSVPPFPDPLLPSDEPVLETNRWDDPRGEFATLYCGSTPEACFAETMAPFRKTDIVAKIDAAMEGPSDPGADFELRSGTVPSDYIHGRALAHLHVEPNRCFVDVDDVRTHAALNGSMPELPRTCGFKEFDRGLVLSADRRITRPIARHYYELSQLHDHRDCAGIRYESRLDGDFECWAMFVPPRPFEDATSVTHLTWANPHLRAAAKRLGLELPDQGRDEA